MADALSVARPKRSALKATGSVLFFLCTLFDVGRWVLAAVGSIAIGFWMLLSPDFRTNQKQFTLDDAAPGLAAILAGLVILGFPLLLWRWRRPATGAKATAVASPVPADVPSTPAPEKAPDLGRTPVPRRF